MFSLLRFTLADLDLDALLSVLTLSFPCSLKGQHGIIELIPVGDDPAHVDLARGDEVDGSSVGARTVAEGADHLNLVCVDEVDWDGQWRTAHADLDEASTLASGVQTRLHARLSSCAFEDDVEAALGADVVARGVAREQVQCVALRGLARGLPLLWHAWLEGTVSAEGASQCQLRVDDVDNDTA